MAHVERNPEDPIIPRAALIAAGALMIGSLIFVYIAKDNDVMMPPAPVAAVEDSRSLVFDKTPGAEMTVRDAVSGEVVALLSDTEDGLMEAMLRGLKHGRYIARLEGTPTYVLTRYGDGRLVLSDPETGVDITLDSFGGRNKALFAALLDNGKAD